MNLVQWLWALAKDINKCNNTRDLTNMLFLLTLNKLQKFTVPRNKTDIISWIQEVSSKAKSKDLSRTASLLEAL